MSNPEDTTRASDQVESELVSTNSREIQPLPPGVVSKEWNWGRIDRGSCTMHYAQLTLYSDGLAEWRSALATDSSGDVWLVQGVSLQNTLGDELFLIPQFNGPRMDVEDMNYHFTRFRDVDPLYFPPQLYNDISTVYILRCHC